VSRPTSTTRQRALTRGPATGAGSASGPASIAQRRGRWEPTSGPTTGAGAASGPASIAQRRTAGDDPGRCRRCRPVVGAGRAVVRPGLTPPLIEGRALAVRFAIGPNPQARSRDRAGNARAPQVRFTQPMVEPRHALPPPSSASLPVLCLTSYPGSLAASRPYSHQPRHTAVPCPPLRTPGPPCLLLRTPDLFPGAPPHRLGHTPVPAVRSPALRPLPSERVAAPGRWWCFPARTKQVRVRGCCCHASGVAESGPLMPDLA
jgi:hypothetical protein